MFFVENLSLSAKHALLASASDDQLVSFASHAIDEESKFAWIFWDFMLENKKVNLLSVDVMARVVVENGPKFWSHYDSESVKFKATWEQVKLWFTPAQAVWLSPFFVDECESDLRAWLRSEELDPMCLRNCANLPQDLVDLWVNVLRSEGFSTDCVNASWAKDKLEFVQWRFETIELSSSDRSLHSLIEWVGLGDTKFWVDRIVSLTNMHNDVKHRWTAQAVFDVIALRQCSPDEIDTLIGLVDKTKWRVLFKEDIELLDKLVDKNLSFRDKLDARLNYYVSTISQTAPPYRLEQGLFELLLDRSAEVNLTALVRLSASRKAFHGSAGEKAIRKAIAIHGVRAVVDMFFDNNCIQYLYCVLDEVHHVFSSEWAEFMKRVDPEKLDYSLVPLNMFSLLSGSKHENFLGKAVWDMRTEVIALAKPSSVLLFDRLIAEETTCLADAFAAVMVAACES